MGLSAKNLKRRITIQQQVDTVDAIGQPIDEWVDVDTVSAHILPLSGIESIKAGADVSVSKASIRIRYREDITPAMRVLYGTTVYQINAVLPDAAGRVYVDLLSEVVA